MVGRLLAITGGHRFDRDAFASMLDAVTSELGWEWAHAEHPSAQGWLRPEHVGVWDAVLLHDIPGLALQRGSEPEAHDPSPAVRQGILDLVAAGQGIVATHHALAGWPTWDGWAELLGGRFLYAPGRLAGSEVPASGYRMDTYTVDVAAPDHPVCSGVDSFELTDELYLCPVSDDVTPLLRTVADNSASTMIDTYREVRFGERVTAAQQPSSPLIGWCREQGPSRLVYLLPGHGPETMEHPAYRRLLANACAWVSHR